MKKESFDAWKSSSETKAVLTALSRLREDLKEGLAESPVGDGAMPHDAHAKGGIQMLREVIEFTFEDYTKIMGDESGEAED